MHCGDRMQAGVEWDDEDDWRIDVDTRDVRDGDSDCAGGNGGSYGGRGRDGWDAAESAGGVERGGDGGEYCVDSGVCDQRGDAGGEEL